MSQEGNFGHIARILKVLQLLMRRNMKQEDFAEIPDSTYCMYA